MCSDVFLSFTLRHSYPFRSYTKLCVMSKVFKRVFQDKQSFRFSVEVLRALNIDQHVSDCAFVSLKKRRKTYQTEMVLPDEHGGLSWNQVLEVSVSLFKDKSNQIWEPKRYNVELVSSSVSSLFRLFLLYSGCKNDQQAGFFPFRVSSGRRRCY